VRRAVRLGTRSGQTWFVRTSVMAVRNPPIYRSRAGTEPGGDGPVDRSPQPDLLALLRGSQEDPGARAVRSLTFQIDSVDPARTLWPAGRGGEIQGPGHG